MTLPKLLDHQSPNGTYASDFPSVSRLRVELDHVMKKPWRLRWRWPRFRIDIPSTMDLNHIEELDDVSFGVEGLYTIESVYIQKNPVPIEKS